MTRKLVAEDRHAVDLPTSGEVALDLFWRRSVIHLFPPKSSSFLSALPVEELEVDEGGKGGRRKGTDIPNIDTSRVDVLLVLLHRNGPVGSLGDALA